MTAIDNLIESFSRFPGIGKKSASRIVHFLLKTDKSFCFQLAEELKELHEKIHPCKICGSYAQEEICDVCSNFSRDKTTICVVEQAKDVQTIEGVREYSGVYHVLGGVIAPLEGIGPDQLELASLVGRIHQDGVKEVILATNPTVEGDTTALYVQKILSSTGVKVTRLAFGIAVGGDLEYTDRLTLARSFRGRSDF